MLLVVFAWYIKYVPVAKMVNAAVSNTVSSIEVCEFESHWEHHGTSVLMHFSSIFIFFTPAFSGTRRGIEVVITRRS